MTLKVYGLTEVCCPFTTPLFSTLPIDQVYFEMDLCYSLLMYPIVDVLFSNIDEG